MDMDKIKKLQEWVDECSNIVFFGGAGVSTESGVPDFRSVDGLYNQKYDYPPEQILSHTFYRRKPEEFYKFYKDKLLLKDRAEPVQPNKAHLKLAELESAGKLKAVVTQNIDGLHQAAGSKVVYEVHGSVMRNYCENCGKSFEMEYVRDCEGVPKCDKCGGPIKPDVVLYEEGLDSNIMTKSIKAIADADMLIIGGTSLNVYPAAGLIDYYRGNKLVLINMSKTPMDGRANLAIYEKIGEVLSQITV